MCFFILAKYSYTVAVIVAVQNAVVNVTLSSFSVSQMESLLSPQSLELSADYFFPFIMKLRTFSLKWSIVWLWHFWIASISVLGAIIEYNKGSLSTNFLISQHLNWKLTWLLSNFCVDSTYSMDMLDKGIIHVQDVWYNIGVI